MTGLTCVLLSKAYSVEGRDDKKKVIASSENLGSKKIYCKILDSLIEGILDVPESLQSQIRLILPTDFLQCEHTVEHIGKTTAIKNMIPSVPVSLQLLRKFFLHILSILLSRGHLVPVESCLSEQTDWFSLTSHGTHRDIFKQIFLVLDLQEVISSLENVLGQDKVNVTSLYTCITAVFVCYEDAKTQFSDVIKQWLMDSLEKNDRLKISFSLLIARISGLIGPPLFLTYQDWFYETFKSSSTAAPTKNSFTTLVKCLSVLVPHDRPECLKAHVLKRPFVPPRCKEIYDDYIALAKTRLMDLNVPLLEPYTGMYNTGEFSTASSSKNIDPTEQDVEKSVQAFAENGKIPTTLVEASIFRKPYFVGKFLPALLTPRLLPDEADCKMKLVEALQKSGRIPASLWSKYTEGCHREKQVLLEAVFDVDDDDDEDHVEEMELAPLEQVQYRLGKIVDILRRGNSAKVQDTLTILCERVKAAVNCSLEDEKNLESASMTSISVDLRKKYDDKNITEVICGNIFQSVSKLLSECKSTHKEGFPSTLREGVITMISSLVQHSPSLRRTLCSQTLAFLYNDKYFNDDAAVSLRGVSLVCMAMMTKKTELQVDGLFWCSDELSCQSLIHAAVHCLSCCTAAQMENAWM